MKGKKKYTKMCLILFNKGVGGSIKLFSSVVLCFGYDGRGMDLRFGCGGCIWEGSCVFHRLTGMEMLEMRRCRGVWVHRREVASFKR